MRLSAMDKLLVSLRRNGVTMYRETDAKGKGFEVHMGPAPAEIPEKKAEKAPEEAADATTDEKYPKDAAKLAFKLVGGR